MCVDAPDPNGKNLAECSVLPNKGLSLEVALLKRVSLKLVSESVML